MARDSLGAEWSLDLPSDLLARLMGHLFPGDGDEHGAVIGAGMAQTSRGTRLLARRLFLARDGVDYVPGKRGYRMLKASFVTAHIMRCADEGLVYLAIHCHGGNDSVSFSRDDLASHERGYPALLDISGGPPVGALVVASNAIAGDLWFKDGNRLPLLRARGVGRPARQLNPAPQPRSTSDGAYDRQARLFGDRGQAVLGSQKVGVIGAGGAGSLIVEYLARLGVGHIVIADNDRLELTNLPRVMGSTRRDAMSWLTMDGRPPALKRLGRRLSAKKTRIAARVARKANPRVAVERVDGDIVDADVALQFVDCDYLFLAADSMRARLVFNAIVHQYLIPGVQVGAKVSIDPKSGQVGDVFSVCRPVLPDSGCLWCNGLISPARLQTEALDEKERVEQRYVEDATVRTPSVVTLNAVAASHAVNDYLFTVTGLLHPDAPSHYRRFMPRDADFALDEPRKDADCSECGNGARGRLGLGDAIALPTR